MTAQQPNSRLHGWKGPIFPQLMPDLIAALEALPASQRTGSGLEERLERVPGLLAITGMTASDGYFWPSVVSVSVHGGLVAVALPAATLDRSPAVYLKGPHTNDATADAVMARIIRPLRPASRRRPIL